MTWRCTQDRYEVISSKFQDRRLKIAVVDKNMCFVKKYPIRVNYPWRLPLPTLFRKTLVTVDVYNFSNYSKREK
jgi:hypothetical protein